MTLTFQSPPRISKAEFRRVLQRGTELGTSPAAPAADECYAILIGYGLDPGVALAFFAHESQFGLDGLAVHTISWGNVRTPYDPSRAAGTYHHPTNGDFVKFASWQDGLRDWCERIINSYIKKRNLPTVEAAIPVYAPAADHNNEAAYIAHIQRLITRWQAEDPEPPVSSQPSAQGGPTVAQLQDALMVAAFEAVNAQYHPEWAFHQYAMNEAKAGRSLGSPLGESRRITVGGQSFAVQVFALDTLYTPVASPENATNWGDIRRLSQLLTQG
jgi:hypothetical protein